MKIQVYLFSLLMIGLFSGCSVTIPETDRIAPTFLFEITSGLPGGPLQISSADDLSNKQLNLRRNQVYRFRYSGSDAGGLQALNLRVNWPTNFVNLSLGTDEYAIVTDDAFFRELLWSGTPADPRSGAVITGELHTIMYNQSYALVSVEWQMTAADYGGTSGTRNTTSSILNVGIVDETQEVGLLDITE